jgi:hypothetical protein
MYSVFQVIFSLLGITCLIVFFKCLVMVVKRPYQFITFLEPLKSKKLRVNNVLFDTGFFVFIFFGIEGLILPLTNANSLGESVSTTLHTGIFIMSIPVFIAGKDYLKNSTKKSIKFDDLELKYDELLFAVQNIHRLSKVKNIFTDKMNLNTKYSTTTFSDMTKIAAELQKFKDPNYELRLKSNYGELLEVVNNIESSVIKLQNEFKS